MDQFWDEQHVIGEVQKSTKNKIVVSRAKKGVVWYIDVRTWYTGRGMDGWLPGKGVAIPETLAGEVHRLIGEALKSPLVFERNGQ